MKTLKKPIEKLSRTELVNLAVEKVKEDNPEFDPSLFLRIRVFQRGKERRIEFSNPVEFVPLQTCAYYSATVYFGKVESVGCQEACNPKDFQIEEPRFYQSTPADEAIITELLQIMGLPPPQEIDPDETIMIYDGTDSYEITIRTKYGVAELELDKETKQVEEKKHRELIPRQDEGWELF